MAVYAIGDLHLSFAVDKPMDIFGQVWENHDKKIVSGFSHITDNDVVVIAGDSSWAMTMQEAIPDFSFIDKLPGKKLLMKGNHDYWWETVSKIKRAFVKNNIMSFDVLHNNAFLHEDTVICGTRGWFIERENEGDKVYKRELGRLEASLQAGVKLNGERIICVLHYPPLYEGYECKEIVQMLSDYNVDICAYGHLHGHSQRLAFFGERYGVKYKMISSDYLDFTPILL